MQKIMNIKKLSYYFSEKSISKNNLFILKNSFKYVFCENIFIEFFLLISKENISAEIYQ